jgi:hypothetical protein
VRRVAALLVGLVGCAGAPQNGDGSAGEGDDTPLPLLGQNACFYYRQVQNFDVLDRSTLVIYAPNRRNAYLVKTSPPSTELRYADTIAFEARTGQVCGRAGDRLVLATGSSLRLSVVDVQRLTDAQLATVLDGVGRGAADGALEPVTDTAADIEPLEKSGDE